MGLLSINKSSFDLTAKMAEVLRIFEVECAQKQITLRLVKNRSISLLHAEHVVADPSRLAQILINFLTNSVKVRQLSLARSFIPNILAAQYTSDSKRREITVYLDACSTPPPPTPGSLRVGANAPLMIPDTPILDSSTSPMTTSPVSTPLHVDAAPSLSEVLSIQPAANPVWITVAVQDSGRGLSPDDMTKLFHRFAQANPKTDQYGGSVSPDFNAERLEDFLLTESIHRD